MFIDETTNRSDLEVAILSEPTLEASFDEQKLLDGAYSDEELRNGIVAWIEAGNEA